ncbi:OLC1v1031891C1 [Oldenlandia corymbosa var. corymbosa]|uniref:OLC1v1031891C1 n=1 Tax=Oldenlandia corymbosa var. corymbosa TaxID=529605 RepID=A0AAV1CJN8_OLDCO|nr:OLC1v1031891C1 [Oldenlandia corymbosa var. corymbosa]
MSAAVVVYLILSILLQACTARLLGLFAKQDINNGRLLEEFSQKKVEVLREAYRLVNLETNLKTEAENRKILLPSHVVLMQPKKFEAAEEGKNDNKGKRVIRQSMFDEKLLPITAEIQVTKSINHV